MTVDLDAEPTPGVDGAGGRRSASGRRRRDWRVARARDPVPHGHHRGGDAHVVGRTGTDGVGIPDVVRLPGTGRSAVEDQVGAIILDHDFRCVGTPFWDEAGRRPVCRCRFVVGVIGRVSTPGRHPGPRNPKPGARSGKRRRRPRRRTVLGSRRFCAASAACAGGAAKNPPAEISCRPPAKGASPSMVHAVTKPSIVLTGISSLVFPHWHFPSVWSPARA